MDVTTHNDVKNATQRVQRDLEDIYGVIAPSLTSVAPTVFGAISNAIRVTLVVNRALCVYVWVPCPTRSVRALT